MLMKFYLPADLDLEQHYAENPPFERFSKDKMVVILSTLITIPIHNKNLVIEQGFVPLSATVLKGMFTDYKRYLTYGLESGLLKSDKSYLKGFKCTGYKIALPYGKDLQTVNLKSLPLKRHFNKRYRVLENSTKPYAFLNAWFAKGLEIDTYKAYAFLKAEYALKIEYPALRDYEMRYDTTYYTPSGKKGDYRKVMKDPLLQYQQGVLSLQKLKEGEYSCHVDATVKRYHSVLTNMRSPLRNYLTFKGEKMVSIDITNSQPYLLCLLLQDGFWKSDKIVLPNAVTIKNQFLEGKKIEKPKILLSSLSNNFYDILTIDALNIDKENTYKDIDYFMLVKIRQTLVKTGYEAYVKEAGNGTLYYSLQPAFEAVMGYTINDRKELKKAMFQVLFTSNQFIGQEQAAPKRIFKTQYPEVYALCNAIKQKDASLLPKLLQRIESHVMLTVIAKRLHKSYPKVPLFTVHDSILTTERNAQLVATVMQEELTRCIGYSPTLAIEPLDPYKSEQKIENLKMKATG